MSEPQTQQKPRKDFPVDRALPRSRWQALKALLEKGKRQGA
jgi:hypothetical protein